MILLLALAGAAAIEGDPFDLPYRSWARCLAQSSGRYAPQPEPIDVIVLGAFGACANEQADFHKAMVTWSGRSYADPDAVRLADQAVEEARAGFNALLTSHVLDLREFIRKERR